MTQPHVQAFFDPATHTLTYLIHDPATREAAIVDPVLDFTANDARIGTGSADAVLAAADAQGLTVRWLLETHAHADHLSAAHYLREKTGAAVVIGAAITRVQAIFAPLFEAEDVRPDGSQFDRLVSEGERLPLGELAIEVLHTPGHTPACVTYLIGDAAFVGDTLFMPDYGTARTDFPGGSAADLYRSVRRILALPEETRIFVGHDYLPAGRSQYRWETTVAEERAANIHVHDGVSEAEFVAMREARDRALAAPQLILPSLQVNIRAGALPPPSPGGRTFLKLPVGAL
ncbi:MBL fold metallo-hydrolase [Erythrobacter sp. WG]|uniref:MBL fold metallo-hydrolase n=1 Tax=Erythrobacter sp. WG TaxID=2985510 RepID=UPI002271D40B|nr:MBL fold metallo-hydrolase [Erythrobacter sp. WG]MCX9147293.1 MBL fold metallo-hydrolase [Erythrobacter sp. WG]